MKNVEEGRKSRLSKTTRRGILVYGTHASTNVEEYVDRSQSGASSSSGSSSSTVTSAGQQCQNHPPSSWELVGSCSNTRLSRFPSSTFFSYNSEKEIHLFLILQKNWRTAKEKKTERWKDQKIKKANDGKHKSPQKQKEWILNRNFWKKQQQQQNSSH